MARQPTVALSITKQSLHYSMSHSLAETAALLQSSGAQYAGDLTDPGFPQKLVDAALSQLGGLDIIVNNAGYTWDNVIQKMTDEQFQAMLNIHLVAPFRILRASSNFANGKQI